MSGRRLVSWAALGGLALVVSAAPAYAQKIKHETARPIASVQGVDTYKAYCASCHGPQAKGDGPAAKALTKAPSDLTTIAKRNSGKFSNNSIEEVIRGTNEIVAHGSRDMPVWGPVFGALSGHDKALETLRVTNLVQYIKSIQTE